MLRIPGRGVVRAVRCGGEVRGPSYVSIEDAVIIGVEEVEQVLSIG